MRFSLACFAAVLSVASSGAWAQTMYRCNNTYQTTPCPGGVAVDAKNVPRPLADAPKAGTSGTQAASNVPLDKAAAERAAAIKKAECDPLKAQHAIVADIVVRGGGGANVAVYAGQKKKLEDQMKAKACNEDPKDAAKKN